MKTSPFWLNREMIHIKLHFFDLFLCHCVNIIIYNIYLSYTLNFSLFCVMFKKRNETAYYKFMLFTPVFYKHNVFS